MENINSFINGFNLFLFVLFACCYGYQVLYVLIRMCRKLRYKKAKNLHRYAVLIPARNEGAVLENLLMSIASQNYPQELVDVYVIADNCTDDTAEFARRHGVNVIERFNQEQVGKGYALNYAFHEIDREKGISYYDGYMVFDADNVLDENFIREMNNTFDAGHRIVTSYRNSKNFDSNWISAGHALWFLRESKFLNGARMVCNTGCAISGTGFLVSSEIIREDDGWKYHLLTEDIEFSIDKTLHGESIAYCERAVLYDEQPITFKQSWNQRMRWAKGFYQVFSNYGAGLIKGLFKTKKFQCVDMFMTVAPIALLTVINFILYLGLFTAGILSANSELIHLAAVSTLKSFGMIYFSMFFFAAITVVSEWDRIYCRDSKKIKYLFTFPVFMFTYIPIAVTALFKKVTWKPIAHTFSRSVQDIKQEVNR